MLVTVLAPPSRFAAWAIPTLRSIANSALGAFDYIHLSTLDRFRNDWQNRKTENVMLFADSPDRDVAQILGRNEGPTIFIHEEPSLVATYCQEAAAQSAIAATRTASISFATLHDVVLSCPKLKIFCQQDASSDFIHQASDFLGWGIEKNHISDILKKFGTPPALVSVGSSNRSSIEQPSADLELTKTLTPFTSLFQRKAVHSFEWPRSAFLAVDKNGAPLNTTLEKEIDLTGPARILVYGPYFHLPRGQWDIGTRFHVSTNISGNELYVEILSGLKVMVRGVTPLPAQGVYKFSLCFTVSEPREPIQVRISILQGAIEGSFGLEEVLISRLELG